MDPAVAERAAAVITVSATSRDRRCDAPGLPNDRVRVVPLGGLGEIGKNMTVFEFGGEIIVVDCGLAFPEPEMYGIDIVIPDIAYLRDKREQVTAFVIGTGSPVRNPANMASSMSGGNGAVAA